MISDIAYSETNYIISKMSEELRKKIPNELIELIKNNDNGQYKINNENVDEIELQDDTKRILSVIYTDYLASKEEREIILNKEKLIELKKEEEKKREFNTDVFANSVAPNMNNETSMTVIKKEKWYKKFFNKIKKFLKI